MRIYTVHHRPRLTAAGDDHVFVAEGFSWAAFLVPFLWALYHGEWLIAFVIVVAAALLDLGLGALALDDTTRAVLWLAVQGLIGYHAGDLRCFLLGRRDYRQTAVIAAPDLATAEARFFAMASGPAPTEPARL